MHTILKFIGRTLLGGVLVLLPAYLAILLLLKALAGVKALIKPLASHLAIGAEHHSLVALVVGYVVEEHTDGRFTVFGPASPTPFSGAVYVLTPERVHIVDVPFTQAFQSMAKWGTGTRELIKAMAVPVARQE